MEVQGVYLTAADGRWLIERLRRIGGADQVWLAAEVEDALAYDVHLALNDRQIEAMKDALTSDVPAGLQQLLAVFDVE
jgi:hypothetical protein